jgi:hypothetical protein
MIDASSASHVRKALQDALKAIDKAVPQYTQKVRKNKCGNTLADRRKVRG